MCGGADLEGKLLDCSRRGMRVQYIWKACSETPGLLQGANSVWRSCSETPGLSTELPAEAVT